MPIAESSGIEPADNSAFRPATELLREPFDTFKAMWAALKANKWIRWQNPSKQRLLIHAGDWSKFLAQQPPDPLDAPAEVVDAALAAQQMRVDIRQSKTEK